MAYTKTNWVNGQTPINATNLNHIENGIESVEQEIPVVETSKTTGTDNTYACDYINDIVEDNYSTSEVKTNKVWIDGKPIYRKVISNITTPSTTNSWVSIGSVSNVSTLINMYGFVIATDGRTLSLNHSEPSAEISTTFKSGNVEMKVILDNWKSRPCYVTLEYTKTTD